MPPFSAGADLLTFVPLTDISKAFFDAMGLAGNSRAEPLPGGFNGTLVI